MKIRFTLLLALCFAFSFSQDLKIPVDTTVTTTNSITIKGKQINYKAETGFQPVWDAEGKMIASLYYTYYKRINDTKGNNRPIIYSFNGGPGSASVWMHIAYTGPKILKIDDEGYPIQPYGVKDNPNSILDVADIVFINPVNTGYSRKVAGKDGKMPDDKLFFGVNADIKYLAGWMNTFTTRHNRWESPKYIIGESYGGTRVMGLSLELQNSQWMYLNGVILVSPADYKVLRVGGPLASSLNLPYYTAAAWYHKMLPPELQSKDLLDILPEAENFAINDLMPAIAKGGFISEVEKLHTAKLMSYYSGLSTKVILKQNLDIPNRFFWKELLRDKTGETIGRLDSRYIGIDNFKTDVKYNVFGNVGNWDSTNDNTRENLRQAMAQNPYLKVLTQSGYYDGATTYFSAKYSQWQIDPSGKMKDRFSFKGYRSGHMMYLRNEDLIKSNDDLREFIEGSLSKGKSAKY